MKTVTYSKPFLAAALMALFYVTAVAAQDTKPVYTLHADGLACPFCAYGIEKHVLTIDAFVYGGIGLLIAASFWNAWPLPKQKTIACGSCTPVGLTVSIETGQQAGIVQWTRNEKSRCSARVAPRVKTQFRR